MKKTLKILSVLGLLCSPLAAKAGACDFSTPNAEERETINQRETPITIPHFLQPIVSTDETNLLVQTIPNIKNKEICFRTAWISSVDQLELLEDARFLSFHYYAMEADGHILIDRQGDGQIIKTGNAPHFTKDGKYFMALQTSGAGWGNLEGLAVWHVDESSTRRLLFGPLTNVADGFKVENFHDSGCAFVAGNDTGEHRQSLTVYLSDDAEVKEGNHYDHCISATTGKTLNEFRVERSAEELGPSDWYAVDDGPDPLNSGRANQVYFADKGSIYGSDGSFSIVTSRLELKELRSAKPELQIVEYRERRLVDCKNNRHKTLEISKYDLDGKLAYNNKYQAETQEWLQVDDKNPDHSFAKFTCKPEGGFGEQRWPGTLSPRDLMQAMMLADWSK